MKTDINKPIIGIIGGRGKMGAYFAELFRKLDYKVLVSDKRTKLTNTELAKKADVVIVSVPIDKTEDVINSVASLVKKEGLIMDLTSLKEFPVRAMLKSQAAVIGLHPMFSHTNPLPGQTVVACPERGRKWFPWIKQILKNGGARVVVLKPKKHDQIMAVVQALVHFADIAFGHTIKDLKLPIKEYLNYASPASELKIAFVGRLLAQDPTLYASIQQFNPHAIKALKTYLNNIEKLLKIDQKKSLKSFTSYFNEAGESIKTYQHTAFSDTNYLISKILSRRQRHADVEGMAKKASKLRKKKADIAVLGPINTFSDIAAKKYESSLGTPLSKAYAGSIYDIFEMVENGHVKYGIVPLENLLNGTVRETFDELLRANVHIINKISLDIRHALVALPKVDKKNLDTIASHGQAIQQCRNFLKKNFPHARRIATPSTIAAYEAIISEKDLHTAAIIPEQVANELNCNILASNIGDKTENRTTFVIIKRGKTPQNAPRKSASNKPGKGTKKQRYGTSIAFYFGKDKPGTLFKVFEDFAKEKINLTRIESRPSRKDLGNYIFYLDFEESLYSAKTRKVLKKMLTKVAKIKVLGTYQI